MIHQLRHLPLRPLPLCFLVALSLSIAIHAPILFPSSAHAQSTNRATEPQTDTAGPAQSSPATTVYTQTKTQTGQVQSPTDEKKIHALQEAIRFYRKGDFKSALARFESLSEQYPNETRAIYYVALCNTQLGQYKEARFHYEEVLRKENSKNPNGPLMKLAKEGLSYLPAISTGSAPVALDNPPRLQGNNAATATPFTQQPVSSPTTPSSSISADRDDDDKESDSSSETSSNEWQGVSPMDMMMWQSMMGGDNNNNNNSNDIWSSLGNPGMSGMMYPGMNSNMMPGMNSGMMPGMNYPNMNMMMPGMAYPGMGNGGMPAYPTMPGYPTMPSAGQAGKMTAQGKPGKNTAPANTTPQVDPQLWQAWLMNQMMQNSTQLMDSNRNDRD